MTEGNENVRDLRIATLDRIATGGQDWPHVADKYGVSNPMPPWKSSLDGICDALDVNGQALPLLERRRDEDVFSQTIYADLPVPEVDAKPRPPCSDGRTTVGARDVSSASQAASRRARTAFIRRASSCSSMMPRAMSEWASATSWRSVAGRSA